MKHALFLEKKVSKELIDVSIIYFYKIRFTLNFKHCCTIYFRYQHASDPDKSAEKLASINQEFKETLKRKEELGRMKQTAEGYYAQGVAMEKHVEKIYQQRVLKRVTFWQNLLNMVFYVVFVLNAVIAGMGLADPNIPVATGETAENISQSVTSSAQK